MLNSSRLKLLAASAAFFAFSHSAFALDGADLVAKLNASSFSSAGKLSAADIVVDGETVTLKGATVVSAADPAKTIALGDVTLDSVEEDDTGGYYVGSVQFADVNIDKDGDTFALKDIAIDGLSIPGPQAEAGLSSMLMYESAHTGPMTVTVKGKEVFSVASTEANVEVAEDESAVDFDLTVADLAVDMTTVPDPQSKDAIEKLGLQTVKGQVTMQGSWEVATGKVDISEYAFDFKDIGKLDLTFSLSGYTLDFIKAMQDAQKAMEANPKKDEAQNAFGMAMMGLVQQLSFNSASIRFDDAGITKKGLDYAGAQQNVTGAQMAESLKGMVPLMLASLNMPELQNQVTEAVNKFLTDPKSISAVAEPANPVPFPQIMGAAMGAPQTLPTVLGVKVTAND